MVKELTVTGVFIENTYFYIDDKTGAGFLIDPGAQADLIYSIIRQNGWKIEKILLTHGHMDHIGAVTYLQQHLNIPVLIHGDDELYLKDPYYNLSGNYGRGIIIEGYQLLKDNDRIKLDENPEFYLDVIHTPGHTPGSVVFYSPKDKLAFVGDTLYQHGPGLTNFPGGNRRDLEISLIEKVLSLPKDTLLYSGHSTPITVGEERKLLLGR